MRRSRVKDLEAGDKVQMIDDGALGVVVHTSIGWHPLIYRIELDGTGVRIWANYKDKPNPKAKNFRMCKKPISFIFR